MAMIARQPICAPPLAIAASLTRFRGADVVMSHKHTTMHGWRNRTVSQCPLSGSRSQVPARVMLSVDCLPAGRHGSHPHGFHRDISKPRDLETYLTGIKAGNR